MRAFLATYPGLCGGGKRCDVTLYGALYFKSTPTGSGLFGVYLMAGDSEGEGGGLAIGILDIIFLVLAVAGVVLLLSWFRRRKKKELVRNISVPIA